MNPRIAGEFKLMRPPKTIEPYVTDFARHVLGMHNVRLFYVQCSPVQGAPENECFALIEDCVARCGGTATVGWAIWERPNVYIEAEFHTIWHSPDGKPFDFSPRTLPIPRILFLPDPRRKYNGTQVNNVRRPLTNDKDVKKLLALADRLFHLTNEGKLNLQRKVVATPKMLRIEEERAALTLKVIRRYGPLTHE